MATENTEITEGMRRIEIHKEDRQRVRILVQRISRTWPTRMASPQFLSVFSVCVRGQCIFPRLAA